jgi:hypothetical protein
MSEFMEDLRVTGYNALLTPSFVQEEYPTVSTSVNENRAIFITSINKKVLL